MSRLVRAHDWAATSLGPMDQWPQSLKTVVDVLLTSRFSMWMGWGPELVFLYNDAYRRDTIGVKHPRALGRPFREVWAEIWDDLQPRIRAVLDEGIATWDEALMLLLERSGYREETYHTFSYSPIRDESGAVAGLLSVVMEETERVIGERRLATLRDLANELAGTTTEQDVFVAAQRVLATAAKDLPFTLTYLFDAASNQDAPATAARLASTSGIDPAHPAAAARIEPATGDAAWPIDALLATGEPVVVDELESRFDALPTGAWDRPPSRAVLVPIARSGQEHPAGVFIAAINPYRAFDAAYAGFVDLVAGQIAASLANARAYEEERLRAQALIELDRAKTEFFSNVSHEFRTPLTLLLGPAEDALADTETKPRDRERLEIIHRNGLRLLKLVNTLLDFSRIEAGRVQATYRPTDLGALTADLASSFRAAVERAGLHYVVDTPSLPEPVYVDREMWEKVVLNLVSNAFKHTFEGEIHVTLRSSDGRATLSVSDTGVGIPASQLPHVFERFHRVPNGRSRTHEGTGIGLALVQELVRLHHGEISVESEEGRGTTFTVRIPLGSAHLPPERLGPPYDGEGGDITRTPSSSAYTAEAQRWLSAEKDILGDAYPGSPDAEQRPELVTDARILLVDDNADMRDYAARLLRARGWTVETAAHGADALEQARRSPPDLVLSDIMMPVLDGFGLLRALRGDPALAATPVILLSARAGEEARVEGLDAGADDYLVKPFAARELVARVGAHLALARERERARRETAAAATRLRRVFAQAPVGIAVVRGPEHVFEIANEPYRRLINGRDVVGRPIREAIPELAGQGIFELLDQVYETKTPYVGSELPVQLQGERPGELHEMFFNFVYQPLFDADGEVEGVAVVCTDVTDIVHSRQAAERAQAEAERANRAKSEFLAAMSHELRTPLNAIAGYAELMDMGLRGPMTEAQRTDLSRIRRSQQHLLSLINDVLNFAKLEAGRFEYDMQPVKLAPIVADLVTMIQPQLATKGLVYRAAVAPDITVTADPEKLQQVLLNLLSNAIKFTDRGGRITVDVATRETGDDGGRPGLVFLRVSDTGIGIPRDKQDAIFDPFVQAHRQLASNSEGTGLGLSISRDLARGMGGDLRVRSVEGEGSVFTLTLQMAQDERGD
jgi:signal transduction histidine kinase